MVRNTCVSRIFLTVWFLYENIIYFGLRADLLLLRPFCARIHQREDVETKLLNSFFTNSRIYTILCLLRAPRKTRYAWNIILRQFHWIIVPTFVKIDGKMKLRANVYDSLIRPRGPSPSLISPHGRKRKFVCGINMSHIVKRFDPQIHSSSKCTSSALLPKK